MVRRKHEHCGPADTVGKPPATDEEAPRRTLLLMAEEMLRRQLATPLAPGLYLVATPIGNLADMTLRGLAVLAGADLVYCEDTRHSAKLLNSYGIRSNLRSYHEHNAERERGPLLDAIEAGKSVALISDAGTPLVSDPGYKLVREARERGLQVTAIPGPSAVLAGLAVAGLPSDEFHFAGFLPPKTSARRKRLRELTGIDGTLILFESPKRLAASLADMADVLGDRPAAVARELTKLHETLATGSLAVLAARFATDEVRGEIVVLVGPAARNAAAAGLSDADVTEALRIEMQADSLRDAVKSVAARLDLPRSKVYDLAVALRREGE